MGKYADFCIKDLIEEINSKYFLPHIQRPFVWGEDKIIKLFDSLLRGYPVGTFLFWNVKQRDIRKRKFITNYYKNHSKNFNIEKLGLEDTSKSNDTVLILDGQQRLQSLFIALKGQYEDKELYFNIFSGTKENEEGIIYEFKFFKDQPRKEGEYWVKVKDLIAKFEKTKGTVANVKKEILPTIEQGVIYDEGTIESNLEYLKDAVLKHPGVLSAYNEDEDSPERVFDIFVRVNSGGTPLGKSDLLFSFIKLTWEKTEAEKVFPALLDRLNGASQFSFDVEFLLKTALMLTGEHIKYSVRTFSGEKGKAVSKKIEDNWPEISKSITAVVDLIRERFRLGNDKLLSSSTSIIPLIYYAYLNKKDSNYKFETDQNNLKAIKQWLLNVLLCRTFSGSPDALLETTRKRFIDKISPKFKSHLKDGDINEIIRNELSKKESILTTSARIVTKNHGSWEIADKHSSFAIEEEGNNLFFYEKIIDNVGLGSFPAAIINREMNKMNKATRITREMLSSISYNSPESYLLLYLIYPFEIEFHPSSDRNYPQQDHIFSQSELKEAGITEGEINRIGNMRLVTCDENCYWKNDMPYHEFIEKTKPELLKMHLIPEYPEKGSGSYNWPVLEFSTFLDKREAMIFEHVSAKIA